MQAVLVMFRSDGERRSFSIVRDMTVIGRREDCDLRIPLGDVSRKHCRVVRDEESLRLEDLGSSNGTYHNGQRVQKEVALSAGDSIQVGPVTFVLQIDGVPADDELKPVAMPGARAGGGDEGSIAGMEELPGGDETMPGDNLDDLDALDLPGDANLEAGESNFDLNVDESEHSANGLHADADSEHKHK
jgi:predicted component of type VI protein secretion system